MNDDYKKQDDTGKAVVPPVTDDQTGEESASGNTPGDVNQVDENYKQVIGNNPDGETIAEEVEKDEKDRWEE